MTRAPGSVVDLGGVADGRIGMPCAGVFGLTALAGVVAGLAGCEALVVDVVVGDGCVDAGELDDVDAVGADVVVVADAGFADAAAMRALAVIGVARGTGDDGSRRTGAGAADGGAADGGAADGGAADAGLFAAAAFCCGEFVAVPVAGVPVTDTVACGAACGAGGA
ncbi:MAG TPA: hypothetical protein VIV40_11290 [Kofleriaceae bacterium]